MANIIAINACSDIENVKHNAGANQCFDTTACLLPISTGAGLWCAIWPKSGKMSSKKSDCLFYVKGFVVELPGNSPNRHMAGEEFRRGNNNGIVAPKIRIKLVTEIWREK